MKESSRAVVVTVIISGEQSVSHEMIAPAPEYNLITIGNCPHLERCSVLQGSVVFYGKIHSLVIEMLQSFLSILYSMASERINGSEKRKIGTKERQRCQAFSIFS
jgi:hypothetical protein